MNEAKRNILGLPLPRLELRWVAVTEDWLAKECIYELVMPLNRLDIRAEDENGKHGYHEVARIEMGRTKCSGGRGFPVHDGKVEEPFRDGSHARWDAEKLMLQVWATCEEAATRIYPVYPKMEVAS